MNRCRGGAVATALLAAALAAAGGVPDESAFEEFGDMLFALVNWSRHLGIDAEEALRLANDSHYGLSGSVFGERERAERVARRVECGAINVNDVLVNYFASDVPMGGWKQSGIGLRHGEPGIKKYCRSESLVITRFGGKRER